MSESSTEIEYRIREVTRYIVTKWHSETGPNGDSGGVETIGEYGNSAAAYDVAYALCKIEHGKLGYALDDPRITYPKIDYMTSADLVPDV